MKQPWNLPCFLQTCVATLFQVNIMSWSCNFLYSVSDGRGGGMFAGGEAAAWSRAWSRRRSSAQSHQQMQLGKQAHTRKISWSVLDPHFVWQVATPVYPFFFKKQFRSKWGPKTQSQKPMLWKTGWHQARNTFIDEGEKKASSAQVRGITKVNKNISGLELFYFICWFTSWHECWVW